MIKYMDVVNDVILRDPGERRLKEERAQGAKIVISEHFNTKQSIFLDFVLSQYVKVGVDELDQDKLAPPLKLKYHNSIQDAVVDLGDDVGTVFADFQQHLYQRVA